MYTIIVFEIRSRLWTYQCPHVQPSKVLNNPSSPFIEGNVFPETDAPDDKAPDQDDGGERNYRIEPDLTNHWQSEFHPDA